MIFPFVKEFYVHEMSNVLCKLVTHSDIYNIDKVSQKRDL